MAVYNEEHISFFKHNPDLPPLHKAAFLGQAARCRSLLIEGADIGATAIEGQSALQVACGSPSWRDKDGNKRFEPYFETVKVLFGWAKSHSVDRYQLNDNVIAAVKASISRLGDYDDRDEVLKILAYFACRSGDAQQNAKVLTLIIDQFNQRIPNDFDPNDAEDVELRQQIENMIETLRRLTQYPPIHQHAYFGEIAEFVQLLRSNPELAQAQTADGKTPLAILIEAGNVESIFACLIIQSNYNLPEACTRTHELQNHEVYRLLQLTQNIIEDRTKKFLLGLRKAGEESLLPNELWCLTLEKAVFTEFCTWKEQDNEPSIEQRYPALATPACADIIKICSDNFFLSVVDKLYQKQRTKNIAAAAAESLSAGVLQGADTNAEDEAYPADEHPEESNQTVQPSPHN